MLNFVEIGVRLRVENKSAHEPARRSLLFCRSFANASSLHSLHAAAFEIIVTAIQHLANRSQFLQIPGHCILD